MPAAGGHNFLALCLEGAGKTMLFRRLSGILLALTLAESTAITKIHSAVAETPPFGLVDPRPFRSPTPASARRAWWAADSCDP